MAQYGSSCTGLCLYPQVSKPIPSSPVPCICIQWLLLITKVSSLKSSLQRKHQCSRVSCSQYDHCLSKMMQHTTMFIQFLSLSQPKSFMRTGISLVYCCPQGTGQCPAQIKCSEHNLAQLSLLSAYWKVPPSPEGIHFGVNILEPWKCSVFFGIGYIRNLTALGTRNVREKYLHKETWSWICK